MAKTLPYWSSFILGLAIVAVVFRRTVSEILMARIAPLSEESFALSEFQSLFSRPARFQWLVSSVVVICGVFVLLQSLSVMGVTLELLLQLLSS